MTEVARPFVKMVGGKTQLLPEILHRLPDKIEHYVEPFVGGGAVFFALAAAGRFSPDARIVLSDANEELINAYRQVRDHPAAIAGALGVCLQSEAHYYRMRAATYTTPVARAVRFIYLNKCCFNGLYRVNKAGHFNVPWNKSTNVSMPTREHLEAVAAALSNVGLDHCDFGKTLDMEWLKARGPVVAYCDPPYVPASVTSNFTAYTKDGFGWSDQVELAKCARQVALQGGRVLLSNADVEPVRRLYEGWFKVESVQARRAINSKGTGRGKVGEVLASAG